MTTNKEENCPWCLGSTEEYSPDEDKMIKCRMCNGTGDNPKVLKELEPKEGDIEKLYNDNKNLQANEKPNT